MQYLSQGSSGANALKYITCKCCMKPSAVSSTFNSSRCQGQLPSPGTVGDGEHLEVDCERYKVVNKFCYLGDMLDCTGGSEEAATASSVAGRSSEKSESLSLATSSITEVERSSLRCLCAKQYAMW